jgi:hypothetical protein
MVILSCVTFLPDEWYLLNMFLNTTLQIMLFSVLFIYQSLTGIKINKNGTAWVLTQTYTVIFGLALVSRSILGNLLGHRHFITYKAGKCIIV